MTKKNLTSEEKYKNAANEFIKQTNKKNIGYTTITFVFLTALATILLIFGYVDWQAIYLPLLLYAVLEVCLMSCFAVFLVVFSIVIGIYCSVDDAKKREEKIKEIKKRLERE